MADPLRIEARDGLAIASVMARKDIGADAIGAAIGADMPTRPGAAFAGSRTILGSAPGTWLILAEDAGEDFAAALSRSLVGLASVSDQSGSYVVHRLSGAAARTVLQRGVEIDLHPDSFGVGSAATTVLAQIGTIVWQIDDAPTYDVAIFRSYAGSFRHWLETARAAL